MGQGGILVVKRPWPSMIRTIWGDPDRYQKSYYPRTSGQVLPGRRRRDPRRQDRLLHDHRPHRRRLERVGPPHGHDGDREALVANPIVAEAAVVGRPDDTTGEAICAFVVLKRPRPTGDEAKAIEGTARLGRQGDRPDRQSPGHPLGDNLPKTRSGKIMRRLLRSVAKGEAVTQDTSTLENPAILDQLAQAN